MYFTKAISEIEVILEMNITDYQKLNLIKQVLLNFSLI